jgi:hypothetical protein
MLIVKRLFLLLPLFALLASCSENFEVAAPYKPITVVYGLMNTGDTAHYIRIQKAFLDENKSAIDMAKVSDSSFYSSITVHLKELNDANAVVNDETLVRVDLNQEGYKKDTGAFFNNYNYAYKTTRYLSPSYRYRLVITNTATGEVDSALTPIITNDFSRNGFFVNEFDNPYYELVFPAQTAQVPFKLIIKPPVVARIFEGMIRFHYVDKDRGSGVQTDRFKDWTFASATRAGNASFVELVTTQRSFYSFFRDEIGPAPAGVDRYLDSADIFVWAGSDDLNTYQQINGAQGGITADQIKPLYTNIKSTVNGAALGLFTTRTVQARYEVGINDLTLDSLKKSSITQLVNIQGRSDH